VIDWAALWPKLVNVARRRCGPDDAQDAVQEVALRLLTMPNPPEFSTAKDGERWLTKVVVNKANTFYRASRSGWNHSAPYFRDSRHLPLHAQSGAVWPDYAALVDARDQLRALPWRLALPLLEYSEAHPTGVNTGRGVEANKRRVRMHRLRLKLRACRSRTDNHISSPASAVSGGGRPS